MVDEVINYLISDINGIYIDMTAGGGGHSAEILKRLGRNGQLIAVDRDEEAVLYLKSRFKNVSRITIIHSNFIYIDKIIHSIGNSMVHGILYDFGVSSRMIDQKERGFSFQLNSKLDMRMDRSQSFSAYEVVNNYEYNALKRVFQQYAEEKNSSWIARRIIESRPIVTTGQLYEVICTIVPSHRQMDTVRRIFQAIRIEVNDELNAIRQILPASLDILNIAGRMITLTYHSLEDKLAKQFFQSELRNCLCPPRQPVCTCGGNNARVKLLFPGCLKATSKEIAQNPRAKSVRMRGVLRIR